MSGLAFRPSAVNPDITIVSTCIVPVQKRSHVSPIEICPKTADSVVVCVSRLFLEFKATAVTLFVTALKTSVNVQLE